MSSVWQKISHWLSEQIKAAMEEQRRKTQRPRPSAGLVGAPPPPPEVTTSQVPPVRAPRVLGHPRPLKRRPPLHAAMRDRRSLRQAVVVKELLDKPLALRRRP